MAPHVTIEELEARQTEIRTRLAEIDSDHAGEQFPDEIRSEWNDLNTELESNEERIAELHARQDRLAELAGRQENQERETRDDPFKRSRHINRHVPDDVHNIYEYRKLSNSADELRMAYRDGAMKVVEQATFPHPVAKREQNQEQLEKLMAGGVQDDHGAVAVRVLATGSKQYERAFGRYVATGQADDTLRQANESIRALSLTGADGGYAIPFVLDPTVILTSSGVVNPLRQISRVVRIVGNEWRGVSSSGVSASYGAEATEASDANPTLAQPTANVEKAQVFIPFSVEVGEDWAGLQSEMARIIQDAKDVVEGTKFLSGAGHASHEPDGLQTGATQVVPTAATATFAIGDLYSLEEALSPRWRARASILANRSKLNEVRQFDQYGGAGLWVRLGEGLPDGLLGYPTFEYSDMSSASTSGANIMTAGDFNQFLIVDRVGLSVEYVPHLFGTASGYPTGQRGLYAYWRNTSKVLAVEAFETLQLL